MNIDLFLNEKSLLDGNTLHSDYKEGKNIFISFMQTVKSLITSKLQGQHINFRIASERPFNICNIYISPNISVLKNLDRDDWMFVNRLQAMCIPHEFNDNTITRMLEHKVYYKGLNFEIFEIGCASHENFKLLSFATNNRWQMNHIELEWEPKNQDYPQFIVNIFDTTSVYNLKFEYITSQKPSFLSQFLDEIFPFLRFSFSSKRQIQELTGLENAYPSIIRHLSELNKAASNWEDGPFTLETLRKSPESGRTLEEYEDERRIMCIDGKERIFSLHTKMTDGYRIYYFPHENIVEIGYIGKHLPTATRY